MNAATVVIVPFVVTFIAKNKQALVYIKSIIRRLGL